MNFAQLHADDDVKRMPHALVLEWCRALVKMPAIVTRVERMEACERTGLLRGSITHQVLLTMLQEPDLPLTPPEICARIKRDENLTRDAVMNLHRRGYIDAVEGSDGFIPSERTVTNFAEAAEK